MDREQHGVVGESAYTVARDQQEPPIAETEMAKERRQGSLAENHGKDDHCRNRVGAEQRLHLRMRGSNVPASLRMRPILARGEKSHGRWNLGGSNILILI